MGDSSVLAVCGFYRTQASRVPNPEYIFLACNGEGVVGTMYMRNERDMSDVFSGLALDQFLGYDSRLKYLFGKDADGYFPPSVFIQTWFVTMPVGRYDSPSSPPTDQWINMGTEWLNGDHLRMFSERNSSKTSASPYKSYQFTEIMKHVMANKSITSIRTMKPLKRLADGGGIYNIYPNDLRISRGSNDNNSATTAGAFQVLPLTNGGGGGYGHMSMIGGDGGDAEGDDGAYGSGNETEIGTLLDKFTERHASSNVHDDGGDYYDDNGGSGGGGQIFYDRRSGRNVVMPTRQRKVPRYGATPMPLQLSHESTSDTMTHGNAPIQETQITVTQRKVYDPRVTVSDSGALQRDDDVMSYLSACESAISQRRSEYVQKQKQAQQAQLQREQLKRQQLIQQQQQQQQAARAAASAASAISQTSAAAAAAASKKKRELSESKQRKRDREWLKKNEKKKKHDTDSSSDADDSSDDDDSDASSSSSDDDDSSDDGDKKKKNKKSSSSKRSKKDKGHSSKKDKKKKR